MSTKKILFCVCSRYGDTVISLVVIKEYIERFSAEIERYLIVVPPQMTPLAHALFDHKFVASLRKRRPLDWLKLALLGRRGYSALYAPWTFGNEPFYLRWIAKEVVDFKGFQHSTGNHYNDVRSYFGVDELAFARKEVSQIKQISGIKSVLLCPESTDEDRSIKEQDLVAIVQMINQVSICLPRFVLAAADSKRWMGALECLKMDIGELMLRKNKKSTEKLIFQMKSVDLVVCGDSAPLHIAQMLSKRVLIKLYTTLPSQIINHEHEYALS